MFLIKNQKKKASLAAAFANIIKIQQHNNDWRQTVKARKILLPSVSILCEFIWTLIRFPEVIANLHPWSWPKRYEMGREWDCSKTMTTFASNSTLTACIFFAIQIWNRLSLKAHNSTSTLIAISIALVKPETQTLRACLVKVFILFFIFLFFLFFYFFYENPDYIVEVNCC